MGMKRLALIMTAVLVVGAAAGTGAGVAAMGAAGAPAPVTPQTPWHTEVACGVPTEVVVPESTDEVTYEGFRTTYGYFKVVATLKDQTRTFQVEGTGYKSADIAPWRAEHVTLLVEPCRHSSPAEPIRPVESVPPVSGDPAPEPQPKPGCYP